MVTLSPPLNRAMKSSISLFITYLIFATGTMAQTSCSWALLGSGFPPTPGSGGFGIVASLQVFNDGSGLGLYAGGSFNMAAGLPAELSAATFGTFLYEHPTPGLLHRLRLVEEVPMCHASAREPQIERSGRTAPTRGSL